MQPDVVVIPAKGLSTGKSRLAQYLSASQRNTLNLAQLVRTVRAAVEAFGSERTFVVSPCKGVEEIVRREGVGFVRERLPPSLNQALEQARAELLTRDVRSISVLPVDLSGVRGTVLREVLAGCGPHEALVVPDRVAQGTNFMRVPAACDIRFSYGPGSFATHVRLLAQAGFGPRIVGCTCLRDDLDDIAHLRMHDRCSKMLVA